MERDDVTLTFQYGKRASVNLKQEQTSKEEASEALEIVSNMQRAGNRRAVPRRWFGAAVASLIACLFALYALRDPYPYIVFPILGFAILITASRETAGAYGRDFSGSKASILTLTVFAIAMVSLFFGAIYIRRAYDLSWVSLAAGLIAGLVVFGLSEAERRSYLTRAERRNTE